MVMGEWRTNETVSTDENGKAKVRGHRGTYDVTITAGNKSKTITMNLTTDEDKNRIKAVVGDDIVIACDNIKEKTEKKKYIDRRDSGKLVEMNMPKIERVYEPETVISSCKDSDDIEIPEVFDSNDDTVWYSKDVGDFVNIELRDSVALNKITVKWGNGYIKRFNSKIEISDDGKAWTLVKQGINGNVDQTIDIGGQTAKYIRISAVDSEIQIRDINIYVK